MDKNSLCPCCSQKPYEKCCAPFHSNRDRYHPKTALELMRSRFSAYALHLSQYIIDTTHPDNPQFDRDFERWSEQIAQFSSHTECKDLKILDFQEKGDWATVTFRASLIQDGKDVSFTEKSSFKKEAGKWLYRSGEMISP